MPAPAAAAPMRRRIRLATLLLAIALPGLAPATEPFIAEPFTLASADGTPLHGEVDLPVDRPDGVRVPAVVLVGGTEVFDRDMHFGASGTDDDRVFLVLARALAARGIASVRHDMRGVRCNPATLPGAAETPDPTPAQRRSRFVSTCVDPAIRAGVDWDTLRDDIAAVMAHARAHPALDPERIVVLAHSEGTLHVAGLVGAGRIAPRGLVLLGPVAEAPWATLRWQLADRLARDFLRRLGGEGEALRVDNAAIEAWCAANGVPAAACTAFLAPDGAWTHATLAATMEQREVEALRAQWLALDPAQPFAHHLAADGGVFASTRWWQQWLREETPVVEQLRDFPGAIEVHLAGRDPATPMARQAPALEAARPDLRGRLVVHAWPALGHALGPDPMLAPMDPEALAAVLASVEAAMR